MNVTLLHLKVDSKLTQGGYIDILFSAASMLFQQSIEPDKGSYNAILTLQTTNYSILTIEEIVI